MAGTTISAFAPWHRVGRAGLCCSVCHPRRARARGSTVVDRVVAQAAGVTQSGFDAAVSQVDPQGLVQIGGFSEAEMRSSYAEVFGLSPAQVGELMIDMWDWYCGELDEQLVAYVRGLRPRIKTGIVSNSADGARREETRRYVFPDLFDDKVYSHEVGLAKPDAAIYALACERLGRQSVRSCVRRRRSSQRGWRGSCWPTRGPA